MPKQIHDIPTAAVDVPINVRKRIDPTKLAELAGSIKQIGVQQPVIVVARGTRYDLMIGERRFRACVEAGLLTVPAIVLEASPTEADTVLAQLTENHQREPLNCVDSARGIQRLMETAGCTAAEASTRMGYSAGTASKWLAVLNSNESIRSRVESGELSASAAYELTRVSSRDQQEELTNAAASGLLSRDSLIRKIKQAQRTRAGGQPQATARVTAALGEGRVVTVSGKGLSLESMIDWLEQLLARARKAKSHGLSLETFVRTMRDQATKGVAP